MSDVRKILNAEALLEAIAAESAAWHELERQIEDASKDQEIDAYDELDEDDRRQLAAIMRL